MLLSTHGPALMGISYTLFICSFPFSFSPPPLFFLANISLYFPLLSTYPSYLVFNLKIFRFSPAFLLQFHIHQNLPCCSTCFLNFFLLNPAFPCYSLFKIFPFFFPLCFFKIFTYRLIFVHFYVYCPPLYQVPVT